MSRFLTFLLTIIVAAAMLHAGTTGKISGRITNAATGEDLAGVNVILMGTSLGAASDLTGHFAILNVPPGEYDIQTSAIGYATVTVTGVRVEIDLTTPLDFQLQTEAVAGQEVVVSAPARVIKQDVSASQKSISADHIFVLPVNSVAEILGLEAGVTSNLGIRGSGPDQVLLMVDGVPLRDERDNSPISHLPLSAIQTISFQTGGFQAEYNNVRSGVINIITKEGDPEKYTFNISGEYSPPAPKNFGISPFDENSFWLRPYLDPAVAWTGSANGEPWDDLNGDGIADPGEFNDLNGDGEWTYWDRYDKRQYTEFEGWIAVSERTLADDDPTNDLSPTAAQKLFRWEHRLNGFIEEPDINIDMGFGGPVPIVSDMLGNLRFYLSGKSNRQIYLIPTNRPALTDNTYNLKINSDLSSTMKLTVISRSTETLATTLNRAGGTRYMKSPSDIAATVDRIGHTLSWRIYSDEYWSRTRIQENVLSAQFTSQVSPTAYWNLLVQRTAKIYRTGPGELRDTSKTNEIYPGLFVDEAPYGHETSPLFAIGDGMGMGGSVSTSRDSSDFAAYYARFNYTNQISPKHQIGTGAEVVYDVFNLRYGMKNLALPDGNLWTDFQRKPLRLMFYFQDKVESKGFIANLGMNAEFIDPNGDWQDLTSPYDTDFFSTAYSPENESEIPQKAVNGTWYLSPRLGISHPITVDSKLYFNYGHYRQVPKAEDVYMERRNPLDSKMSRIGDPSLPLAKTISYELGYDQAIGNYLLHLAAYYKDVTNQQDLTRYINIKGNVNYFQLTANNFEDIRGFEIDLSKDFGEWVQGAVNYEYRVQTSGNFGVRNIYENPSEQRNYLRENPPVEVRNLPRPRFKGYLTISSPANFGPRIAGQYLMGGWLVNLIGYWTEGRWFTWNPKIVKGLGNNVRWKPYQNVDLKAAKSFHFGRMKATFFMDVSNVFNFKIFSQESFYNTFDYKDYMHSLHLPADVTDELTSGVKIYPGIAGDDRPGDVRAAGVGFVPMEWTANIENYVMPSDVKYGREMYVYDNETGQYFRPDYEGGWVAADQKMIDKVLDTKAYIDMPNQTYFTFLNPRDIYFGFNLSFDIR